MEIVKKLMLHMDKAEGSHYRDELLTKIIEICSQSNYQYITNFEWLAVRFEIRISCYVHVITGCFSVGSKGEKC